MPVKIITSMSTGRERDRNQLSLGIKTIQIKLFFSYFIPFLILFEFTLLVPVNIFLVMTDQSVLRTIDASLYEYVYYLPLPPMILGAIFFFLWNYIKAKEVALIKIKVFMQVAIIGLEYLTVIFYIVEDHLMEGDFQLPDNTLFWLWLVIISLIILQELFGVLNLVQPKFHSIGEKEAVDKEPLFQVSFFIGAMMSIVLLAIIKSFIYFLIASSILHLFSLLHDIFHFRATPDNPSELKKEEGNEKPDSRDQNRQSIKKRILEGLSTLRLTHVYFYLILSVTTGWLFVGDYLKPAGNVEENYHLMMSVFLSPLFIAGVAVAVISSIDPSSRLSRTLIFSLVITVIIILFSKDPFLSNFIIGYAFTQLILFTIERNNRVKVWSLFFILLSVVASMYLFYFVLEATEWEYFPQVFLVYKIIFIIFIGAVLALQIEGKIKLRMMPKQPIQSNMEGVS